MQANEIEALVTASATRFGAGNPQQLAQLTARLGKEPGPEVALALVGIFTHGSSRPNGSATQELAGALLAALNPRAELEAAEVIRASLSRYELSVEQFPLYLQSLFGDELLRVTLDAVEREQLSAEERHALQTMRFWLRNVGVA
jgi:hypothetical protein